MEGVCWIHRIWLATKLADAVMTVKMIKAHEKCEMERAERMQDMKLWHHAIKTCFPTACFVTVVILQSSCESEISIRKNRSLIFDLNYIYNVHHTRLLFVKKVLKYDICFKPIDFRF